MDFYVYKRGVGSIFGCRPNKLVRTFATWKQAHDFIALMADVDSNFNYFMTNNPNLDGQY